jgi:CheY-like chemotaxis protein
MMIAMDHPTAQIFLGEDNIADVYLIEQALKEAAVLHDLKVARHGEEMLELLKTAAIGGPAPDLIILDLNLPRHDGLDILRFIRGSVLNKTPVVILTSSDSPKDIGAASHLGADRYIRKPSQLEAFMAIGGEIRSLLKERQSSSAVYA